MQGNELQFIKCGKINNVDVRQGIKTIEGNLIDVLKGATEN
ncbi:MAG: hypothetical protein R2771_11565 [Saprospiraceae bacterium]